eukprot:gene6783-16577_t
MANVRFRRFGLGAEFGAGVTIDGGALTWGEGEYGENRIPKDV